MQSFIVGLTLACVAVAGCHREPAQYIQLDHGPLSVTCQVTNIEDRSGGGQGACWVYGKLTIHNRSTDPAIYRLQDYVLVCGTDTSTPPRVDAYASFVYGPATLPSDSTSAKRVYWTFDDSCKCASQAVSLVRLNEQAR